MRVGFIGLGRMGGPMATNVLKAGFALVVHDTNPQAAEPHLAAGAEWAESPQAVAATADVILTSLPGPPEVEAVALGDDGIVAGLKPGSAYFDLSTSSATLIRQIHATFAQEGVHVLDAPVSGGAAGAASRRLALWVGGERAIFDQHKAVLDAIGDQPIYVGPIGAGVVVKLVHNAMTVASQCAISEVFTLGVKAGVEPLALWEAVRQGAFGRRAGFDGLEMFLSGQFDKPSFALSLAKKDLDLATAMGREFDVPTPIVDHAMSEMCDAVERGWGDRDARSVMQIQEERAQVRIAVDPDRLRQAISRVAEAPKTAR